jgi:antirestriction protein
MTTLYAQPYDLAATGFYYESADEYAAKAGALRNDYGQPVEEFEIQFIDGETIDAQLFEALGINQCNHGDFFAAVEDWIDEQKVRVIIALQEGGNRFVFGVDDPDEIEVDVYEVDTLSDLAMQFVEEGLFGTIPKAIENYLDYDAIARDLAMDYGMTTIDGTRYAYRAA